MKPPQDFVDNHSTIFQREAEIKLGEVSLPVEIVLSEGGQLHLEISRTDFDTGSLESKVYQEVTGTTKMGEQVIVKDLICIADGNPSLNPQVIEICESTDKIVRGEQVTIHCDALGFQYKKPIFSNPDDNLKLLERTDWRVGGGNYADWSVAAKPLADYKTRVNSIQKYQNLVRTVRLEVSISGVYGGMSRVAGVTDKILEKIQWVSSFVQGTVPSYSILKIIDDGEMEYIQLRNLSPNGGGYCRKTHLLLFMPQYELPSYLDRVLERYLEIEEQLELRKILGFYVDSLHPNRPVNPKFANLCIATEMLAKKYLPDQGSTEDQIKALIDELDVQFMDLIPENGSLRSQFDTELEELSEQITLEYFWYKSRNDVIHGGREVTTQEIIRDYQALLVLLRRILRKILLQGDTDGLDRLNELEPANFIFR
jgi:hypothetical protein